MTTGSWEPSAQNKAIPIDAIKAILELSFEADFPTQSPVRIAPIQPFMKVSQLDWQACLAEVSSEDLVTLCRFFTLAEANWSDWFGGDKNPVIWICKELKKRELFPDKELTAWIKQNSDNRFLPYGNVFG